VTIGRSVWFRLKLFLSIFVRSSTNVPYLTSILKIT
jgi:hypothetical protein